MKSAARRSIVPVQCTPSFMHVGVFCRNLATSCTILTTWFTKFALWHDDNADKQHSAVGYTVLAWFHHISDLIIRLVMGMATRLVMVAWTSGEKELRTIEKSKESNMKKFSNMVQIER